VSSTIGEKIRNVRETLGMGRQEFVEKTGIAKGTLIGVEQGNREPKAGILIAIANAFPEYAAYLLSDEIGIKQKNPEVENLAKELPIATKAK
jgi:transcriptional regulator with XRE-family HTH domain